MNLEQILNSEEKASVQRALKETLVKELDSIGSRLIGYQGGQDELEVYSEGEGGLWYSFAVAGEEPSHRYWNAFGIYRAGQKLSPVVEVNVRCNGNDSQVAGCFAKERQTGATYLVHNGKIGGGRKGIGQSDFLEFIGNTESVSRGDGTSKEGIVVGRIDSEEFVSSIRRFVDRVAEFKDRATNR